MKRKVKFQEGGAVETPGERRARLADRNRDRAAEFRAAQQRDADRRAADQRAIDRLNPGQTAGEAERRAGRGVPERRPDFTTDTRGTTRRGADTGREMVPYREPGVPATQGGRGMVPPGQGGTPRQIPLFPSGTPQIPGPVRALARRFIPGLGALDAVSPTSLEAGAQFERENMRRAQLDAMQANLPAGPDVEAEQAARGPAPSRPAAPAPTPRPRQPAPRPVAREEISADRLNELAMGAEPMNRREGEASRAIRNRREDLAEAGTAFRKGGMVKQKAKPVAKKVGGMVKSAPKKMMKGGIVAKPKSKAKPMPAFKKGGMIKKGKK